MLTKKQQNYAELLRKAKDTFDGDEIDKIETLIYDEMDKIDKEISSLEKEIKEKRKQIQAIEERRDKKAKKEEEKLPIIKKKYENEVWQYLCAKVRADRKNGVIAKNNQLDDDDTLLSLSNQKEESTIDIQNTIKELTDEAKVEIETIEKSIKPMEAKLGRKNAESSFYWDLIKPPKSSSDESTVSVYSSTPSYIDDSAYSYSGTSSYYSNTSTSDDSRAFEDALKRDREARWKHEEEERRREERRLWDEKKRQEAQERTAHRKQVWDEINARKERERNLRHQCNTCSLASKCYMRGSFPCPTYRPR